MTMVTDVNSATIAKDSSFLGLQNLLIVIIFVDCYSYYLFQLALPAISPTWG